MAKSNGLRVAGLLLQALIACGLAWPAHAVPRAAQQDAQWIDPWSPGTENEAGSAANSAVPTLGTDGLSRFGDAIARYRRMEARGGWPRIPEGEPLEKGVHDPRVALLRARLAASGDMAQTSSSDPQLFDQAVADGVRRFQARLGMRADGTVGRATVAALNVPAGTRVRQLEINMRRIANATPELPSRYVFVNIAGQQVEAVEGGRVSLRKRVIVGKEDRQTPEYTSRIGSVTLNPYWNVPQSIAMKDLLPKIRSNPGFLDRMGIRVLRGDGSEVDAASVDWRDPGAIAKYRLRQDPSRYNSLGTVRINFPNPHAVYLHDTPVRTLFSRNDRSFSSGCVRVEDIRDLAAWLLRDAGWTRARIDRAIADGEHTDVALARPMPIYMIYLTAWVGEDGTVNFRDDVYGRDGKLSASFPGR
ncbi:MAG: L,D-transpeptidase family protein [Parvibaculum sp.]|uniref:L,D-transpeptidase family protein n=1 Tax=Parvibaculum sp. TaxID=2024848 RepID=UPI003C77F938